MRKDPLEDRGVHAVFVLPAKHTAKELYDFLKLHEKANYVGAEINPWPPSKVVAIYMADIAK